MILILADATDHSALWLGRRLADFTPLPVRVLTPVQLLCARSIVHRLDTEGGGFAIETAAGERIDDENVTGIVNRLVAVPTGHLRTATEADRRYAEEELFAFLLGLLAAMDCPVLNPASPDCLAGAWHGSVLIRHFAATAGLHCDAVTLVPGATEPPPADYASGDRIHFALDGKLIGPVLPGPARDRLLAFAQLWGTRLLQIHSRRSGGKWRLVGATGSVDFRLGGRALLSALARLLAP